METEGLQPVMFEDCIEEVGEGGNQASNDAAHKGGLEGALQSLRHGGDSPELILPFSLFSPTVSRRVATRFFSETLGASRAGSYHAGGKTTLDFRGAIGGKVGRGLKQI